MLTGIESSLGGLGTGAVGTAMGKDAERRAAEKAEALAKGRAANGDGNVNAKLRGVAEEFVSVFMNQVMKSMRSTVPENSEFHGDNGEKFFQEMLDTEQAKTMSKGAGYGLTDLIYQALLRKTDMGAGQAGSAAQAENAAGVAAVAGI